MEGPLFVAAIVAALLLGERARSLARVLHAEVFGIEHPPPRNRSHPGRTKALKSLYTNILQHFCQPAQSSPLNP